MIAFNNGVANVRQTPGISADTLANRPAATVVAVGTIYITSDTNNIYRSDGENWQLIGSGSGSVPGIDDVLSVSQNLTDNRLIDINGNNLDITDQNTGSVLCIFSSAQGQFFGITSGLSLLRLKPKLLGSNSNRRWMVFASNPVDSDSRFAALPGGAHRVTVKFFALTINKILLTRVVFPTPGPPVITTILLVSASRTASFCESDRVRPVLVSTHGNAFTASICPHGGTPSRIRWILFAVPTSAK